MALQICLLIGVAVLGAVIGSFLNVCIYRLPWEKSIIWPGSHCPNCLHPIRAYDNVPVLSWLLLRGRCRDCGAKFSPRYALIEAFTAAMFAFVLWMHMAQAAAAGALPAVAGVDYWRYAYQMVLIAALVVATFIDLDLQIIPDSVTVPGMLVGLIGGVLIPGAPLHLIADPAPPPAGLPASDRLLAAAIVLVCFAMGVAALVWQFRRPDAVLGAAEIVLLGVAFVYLVGHTAILAGWPAERPWPGWPAWLAAHAHWHALITSLVGLLAGAGLVWIVRVVGTAALRKEAMGFGDVTLMAMVGAFLGWQPVVLVFFLAPFFGLVVGLIQWLARGDNVLPYGPYLSLATLAVLLTWLKLWPAVQGHFDVLQAIVPVPLAILVVLPILTLCLMRNWRRSIAPEPTARRPHPN